MLQAAVRGIAEVELNAATATIARCAGVAAGTLSTYFPNKEERGTVDGILSELETRGALRALPTGFAAATMAAMQEERWNFITKQPKRREELIEQDFQVFWRALR